MSPVPILFVCIWLLPLKKHKELTFSTLLFFEFIIILSVVSSPVCTLNIESFPTKGSAIVLNTNAENGISLFGLTNISLLLLSIATLALLISGDGKYPLIESNRLFIPTIDTELPHITGAISPSSNPIESPL